VGSAGSKYTGSRIIRGVSHEGAGSMCSNSGTNGVNPGGGARGSLVAGPSVVGADTMGAGVVPGLPASGVGVVPGPPVSPDPVAAIPVPTAA
jgi:hypothetical protein